MELHDLFGIPIKHRAYGFGVIKSTSISAKESFVTIVFSSVGKILQFDVPGSFYDGTLSTSNPQVIKAIEKAVGDAKVQASRRDAELKMRHDALAIQAEPFRQIFEKYSFHKIFWEDIMQVPINVIDFMLANYKPGRIPICMAYEEPSMTKEQKKYLSGAYYSYKHIYEDELKREQEEQEREKERADLIRHCKVLYEHFRYDKVLFEDTLGLDYDALKYMDEHYRHGKADLVEAYLAGHYPQEFRATLREYYGRKKRIAAAETNHIKLRYGNHCYYLHDYHPRRKAGGVSADDFQIREAILNYKDNRPAAIKKFTSELMLAIGLISDVKGLKDKSSLCLCAIPSSKVNKPVSMRNSISTIAKCAAKTPILCRLPVIDCGNAFTRKYDVNTSHIEGPGLSVEEHIDSIDFHRPTGIDNNAVYIIMDDIITTGTQLNACRTLMERSGIPGHLILGLTIGRTVSEWKN